MIVPLHWWAVLGQLTFFSLDPFVGPCGYQMHSSSASLWRPTDTNNEDEAARSPTSRMGARTNSTRTSPLSLFHVHVMTIGRTRLE
jgi:hypothetical protein